MLALSAMTLWGFTFTPHAARDMVSTPKTRCTLDVRDKASKASKGNRKRWRVPLGLADHFNEMQPQPFSRSAKPLLGTGYKIRSMSVLPQAKSSGLTADKTTSGVKSLVITFPHSLFITRGAAATDWKLDAAWGGVRLRVLDDPINQATAAFRL